MTPAVAALALALAAASDPAHAGGGGSAADLSAAPPAELRGPARFGSLDAGPFQGPELAGAGLGVLAGDALVFGAAYGTYRLFTDGVVSPTATNFRRFGIGLAATALLVPPLAAALGGRVAQGRNASGDAWKAFLLSLVGHTAALAVGYVAAPNYWAVIPVQLATMSAGTSVGLHWGPRERSRALPEVSRPPAGGDRMLALLAPVCADEGG